MHLLYLRTSFLFAFIVSVCALGAQEISANYFQGDTLLALSQSGSGPSKITFTIDEPCEQLKMEVTDPVNDPLGTSKPFSVRVRNADGDRITDLTDRLTVTMRARSAGEVPVEFLFRSGDGTADFRTSRRGIVIPAGLDEWTEMSVTFDASDFGPSFDPADIRDFWFYLDRSNENFVGNEFYIDHIVLGGAPDPAQNSPCFQGGGGMETDTMFAAAYFQGDTLLELSQSGSAPSVTTFTYDEDCEQLKIEITDPINAPQGTSKPYSVRLRDADNNPVTNLTDRLTVTMRARSAGEVPVEFLFRSGDGTADFRTSRRGIVIPAGLDEWTEMSVTFEAADFGPSFDPADIRDLWFYLDRSNENFVGNEFYIDHIVTGGAPDAEQNSPCMLGGNDAQFFVDYFQADTLTSFNITNAAARRTTFTLDTDCEAVILSVTDTLNDPLPAFNAFQVNPTDENGDRITDITGNTTVTMRVRSPEAVNVSVLLRSGDGMAANRSDRLDVDIPAGLEEWTEFTLTFTAAEIGGFDAADLRDVWFYLDRGTENFNGNEFHIDHIAIGTLPDATQNSLCPIDDSGNPGVFVDYFQADTLTSFTTNNRAGRATTFTFDAECEAVVLAVTDPVNDPLPPFNAFQVNPTDDEGDITDISGNLNVTMRVRSAEAVNVSILLRSGGGTMEERTERLAVDIPGGLEEWTQFTVAFSEADLAGFNPTDLRDIWFYLDRGEANFSGNFFAIDHIAVGTQPDAAQDSPCSLVSVPTEFVAQFPDSASVSVLGGAEIDRLTLSVNDCEEVSVAVTDPMGAPFGAFRPIVINPTDGSGAPITNVEGQTDVFIRIRSAEEFPVSVLFRSGDGSAAFRTAAVSRMVEGDLTGWSNLTFSFSEADLGDFDPTDLIDMWVYLDRENDNFPGNEVYIDYIAIGSQPDTMLNSPCGLPDLVSGTNEATWASNLSLYPNPTGGMLTVEIPQLAGAANRIESRLLDLTGRAVRSPLSVVATGRLELDLTGLPAGIYFLQLTDAAGGRALRRIVKR